LHHDRKRRSIGVQEGRAQAVAIAIQIRGGDAQRGQRQVEAQFLDIADLDISQGEHPGHSRSTPAENNRLAM
jgi:hypothetical protein